MPNISDILTCRLGLLAAQNKWFKSRSYLDMFWWETLLIICSLSDSVQKCLKRKQTNKQRFKIKKHCALLVTKAGGWHIYIYKNISIVSFEHPKSGLGVSVYVWQSHVHSHTLRKLSFIVLGIDVSQLCRYIIQNFLLYDMFFTR